MRATDINPSQSRLLTLSNDTCALWSTSSGQTILKTKTLQAQQGCYFSDARFSPCGTKVATLFRDGSLVLWAIDAIEGVTATPRGMYRPEEEPVCKLQFPSTDIKLVELGPGFVVGAGPQCPFIVLKDMKAAVISTPMQPFGAQGELFYRLPNNARGVEQIQLLRDKYLLAYISEGIFYLVDINPENRTQKIKISLELRVPGHKITRFDVDNNMRIVALATAGGNLLMYDLAKALENETLISKKKLQMGVEDELVYTYLKQAVPEEFDREMAELNCNMSSVVKSQANGGLTQNHYKSNMSNQSCVNINMPPTLTEEKTTMPHH